MTDTLSFRDATRADLPVIIAMLADDQMGGRPDDPTEPLDPAYIAAFEAIAAAPNERLIVAEVGGRIVGTMQLTLLPGLLDRGAWRGQVEAVRVVGDLRSAGIGARMIGWALDWFRANGCYRAQLTSNNDRTRAHDFYERLGWTKSHAGFKIVL